MTEEVRLNLLNLIIKYFSLWLNRGLCFWKLNLMHCVEEHASPNSLAALFTGTFLASIILFFVTYIFEPRTEFGPLMGVPLYTAPLFVHELIFIGLIVIFSAVFRIGVRPRTVLSLTAYTLSGLAPVIVFCGFGIYIEATKLFIQYHDPSLPYMKAATIHLLSDTRTVDAAIRNWLFVCLLILAGITFMVNLARLLVKCSSSQFRSVLVPFALIVTLAFQVFIVRDYGGRWYWHIVRGMLRSEK